MRIKRNSSYPCRVVRIEDEEVNYFSLLVVDEECISKIEIIDVELNCYRKIESKSSVNIVVICEEQNLTLTECFLIEHFARLSSDCAGCKIKLKYVSSLALYDYVWKPEQEIWFNGIICEITETTELLGEYPYQIEYDELMIPKVECEIKGDVVIKSIGHGFSYFVAPSIVRKDGEIHASMYGKIQFCGDKKKSIGEVKELLNSICLFFEILAGEMITIKDVCLKQDEISVETVGLYNFTKGRLHRLQSEIHSKSYLRKGIFKISDFNEKIEDAVDAFCRMQDECKLAFEAYKQILLDEEIKISTYNKFLKVMQIVEGFQRKKIDVQEEKEFNEHKVQIMEKLNQSDKDFIKRYTSYNGQGFRKCMKDFTFACIYILSELNKTKAQNVSEGIIRNIIEDRDVYTHASKEKKPILSITQLQSVNYCYKIFFRVLILKEMGLEEEIIRKRLMFDHRFLEAYKSLFGLEIVKETSYGNTGEFDELMW